jgi:hypothetical protein
VRAYLISCLTNEIYEYQTNPAVLLEPYLAMNENFLEKIILRNFNRITRISNLASYASSYIQIEFDRRQRPLFLDYFDLDRPEQYLFKDEIEVISRDRLPM